MRSSCAGLLLAIMVCFIAGLLFGVVTGVVEQAGIEGDGWSLRGNGAVIVPVCGLPVVLILVWARLAAWLHADRQSCTGGVGAGVLALSLSALTVGVSRVLFALLLLVGLPVAVLFAFTFNNRQPVGWLAAAGLTLPVAAYAGLLVGASLH